MKLSANARRLQELEARQSGLRAELARVEQKLSGLDALRDLDTATALEGRRLAVLRGLQLLESELPDLRAAVAAEQDAEQQAQFQAEREQAERAELAALRAVVDAATALRAAIAGLEATDRRRVGWGGSRYFAGVGPARRLSAAVDSAFHAWRTLTPELLGLPARDPRAEAIAQAAADVERMKGIADRQKAVRTWGLEHQSAWKGIVANTQVGLDRARQRLARLRGDVVADDITVAGRGELAEPLML